jgi:hypothetical protein
MNSAQFIIWLKGFTEACEGLTASPKQWERIKEVLNEVQDYDDNPDLDDEIDDWYGSSEERKDFDLLQKGALQVSSSSGIIFTTGSTGIVYNATVWNDKMGCWHYTNYPEGFGYYTNSTAEEKNKKQQLND